METMRSLSSKLPVKRWGAREGKGPTLTEAMTYRLAGHSRRSPCNYQSEKERKKALEREPIKRFAKYLISEGIASQRMLDEIRNEIDAEIERAVESAMAAPDPPAKDALKGLFT